MAPTMAPSNNISAYMKRVAVELDFSDDGHSEQHREHAVPVQQQARLAADTNPKTAPILQRSVLFAVV